MEIPTTFDGLPDTVKKEIFSNLDKEERGITRRVAFNWAVFVNRHYGFQLIIDNENSKYLLSEPMYKNDVHHIKMVSLTRDIPSQTSFCPEAINDLELVGIVVTNNLMKIFKAFSGLQHVTFSKITLEKVDLAVFQNLQELPMKLKAIRMENEQKRIYLTPNEFWILKLLSYANLDDLNSFVIQREGSLLARDEFSIVGKVDTREDFLGNLGHQEAVHFTQAVTDILVKAKKNLKTLYMDNFESLVVTIESFTCPDFELNELTASISERSLWPVLLSLQTSLTKLVLTIEITIWENVLKCIQRCENTLKRLEVSVLDYGEFPNNVVDIGFLNSIRNLEVLKFETPLARKKFENFPNTLQSLCLSGPMRTEELVKLIPNLTNLKRLCLKHFGLYSERMGFQHDLNNGSVITLDIFKYLIGLPKIRKIVFLRSKVQSEAILPLCEEHGIQTEFQRALYIGEQLPDICNMIVYVPSNFDSSEIV